LETKSLKISSKKSYSKPEITRIILDNSISLVMMTTTPPNPPPRGGVAKERIPLSRVRLGINHSDRN